MKLNIAEALGLRRSLGWGSRPPPTNDSVPSDATKASPPWQSLPWTWFLQAGAGDVVDEAAVISPMGWMIPMMMMTARPEQERRRG